MATQTFDYSSDVDIRLPLIPGTPPSERSFVDIDSLFLACRLLAEGLTETKATIIPDAPADGEIYGRQDNSWVVVTGGGGGGAGEYSLVQRLTVDTSVPTITFTDLDLVGVREYKIKVRVPGAPGQQYIKMFVNGDTVESNYYRTYLVLDNTSISGNNDNTAYILDLGNRPDGFPASGEIVISQLAGQYPVASGNVQPRGANISVPSVGLYFSGWGRLLSANVTRIDLSHGTGWKVGSVIELYKQN